MSSKNKTTAMKEEARPALVPKLRFPAFRGAEEWTLEAGDTLFDQINDRNPEPGLPVLAITQEHGAIPRHMIDYHVSVTEKSIESYKVVRVGDFIISLRSFQGGIEYSQYHGICSPAYVILRRRCEGSDEYFRHYLKTERFIRILTKNLEGLRDGKMISYAQFSELRLPVPKPPEQQKIAECLSSVDDLMAAQARKVDALKTHKKGLMQQLFPREGETQPRLRFPEFQNAGEWEIDRLDVLIEVIDGDRGTNYPKAEDYSQSEYCLFLSAANVSKTGFKFDAMQFVSKEKDDSLRKGKLKRADVVLTTRGTVGQFAFYSEEVPYENIRINSGMVILRVKAKKIVPAYLYSFTSSEVLRSYIKNTAFGNAQQQLTVGEINKFQIYYPGPDKQQRIASCLSSLDALITLETQKLEALKTHKKGLMQQLFPSCGGVPEGRGG